MNDGEYSAHALLTRLLSLFLNDLCILGDGLSDLGRVASHVQGTFLITVLSKLLLTL